MGYLRTFRVLVFAVIVGLVLIYDPEGSKYDVGRHSLYDIDKVSAPRVTGTLLSVMAWVLRTWPFNTVVIPILLNDNQFYHIRQLAGLIPDPPLFYPLVPSSLKNDDGRVPNLKDFSEIKHVGKFRYATSFEYVEAYKSGLITPTQVAESLLTLINSSDKDWSPPLGAFVSVHRTDVLAQAAASTLRYKSGTALGPLDGVPISVKDEMDVAGHNTTVGTKLINYLAAKDAYVIQRLRAQGAIIVGKTGMHEIGIGTTGLNVFWGTARNPYNLKHFTGGSSSGAGSSVSSGLVPIAIGCDGGGSIRIPASLTGVVGYKATFGRASGAGGYPLGWSVGHYGPLAATVRDAALAYAVLSGRDENDVATHNHPPVDTHDILKHKDISKLRIGIFWDHFLHSDPEVHERSRQVVDKLVSKGAKIINITIPHLDTIHKAHTVVISSEMATSMGDFIRNNIVQFSKDTQINLLFGKYFSSSDYIAGNKIRAYALRIVTQLYVDHQLDVIVSPTMSITAPEIRAEALENGQSDVEQTFALMRYAPLANLCGFPAMTLPIGVDSKGLPIGLQLMGLHWTDTDLLRWGLTIEDLIESLPRPSVYYNPLQHTTSIHSGTGS